MEEKVVKLNELAEKIGNEPKQITLPNGQTRMSINWDAKTAQAALEEVRPLGSSNQKIIFDGPMPGWFASALTHSVHPMPVGLYDPKLGEAIAVNAFQCGAPNENCGVEFHVTEGKNFVRLDWVLTDPVFDVANMEKIVVPEIPNGKDVVVGGGTELYPNSGKGPNYIAVAIGEAYAHLDKSVSYYQPQTNGYTVGVTHVANRHVGDVISKEEVDKDLQEFALEKVAEKLVKEQNLSKEEIAKIYADVKSGKSLIDKDYNVIDNPAFNLNRDGM